MPIAYSPYAAHLPTEIEYEGAIARSKRRVLFPPGEELPPLLREAGGSCVHVKHACGRPGLETPQLASPCSEFQAPSCRREL